MAFTSTVISNAHLGTWDYYIMSDNVAVWRTLNGLASWFSANSGIVQAAALMGALITLALVLFGAAAHSKVLSAGTLGIWFFFMAGMGMTGRAQVTNIYTNQVTVINNVPALALIPASMFSKAGYNVFKSMETAFQGVNPSYMTVNANSFGGPLDVLLALRSPRFPDYLPYLNKSLVQVVHDCAENPTGGAALEGLSNSKDALDWLKTNGRQNGLTKYYTEFDTTGQGTVTDCKTALFGLDTAYTTLAAGSSAMVSFLNTETTKKNPQASNGAWTGGTIGTSWNFLYGAVPGLTQTAQEFTKNALTATTIKNTMDCISQSGMLTSPETCMAGALASADGKERWKTEAAMAGSGFLKTMFTSMGFLQILFFSLFPFIAIYGLVVVHKTGKIFGGYILLGIWSQSWMIVVAPIQSYIQTTIIDDMTKALSTSHAVTLANMGTVYDQLSTKLGVASDMMANAQMLSLALLSGSVVALSSLAGKWNASGNNDSSLLQNKPTDSAPLFKNGSSLASIGSFRNDKGGTTSSLTEAGAADVGISSVLSASLTNASSNVKSRMSSEQRAKTIAAAIQKSTGIQVETSQVAAIQEKSDAVTQFTGVISSGAAGDILKGLMKSGHIKQMDAKQFSSASSTLEKAHGQAVQQLAAKDTGFMSRFFSKDEDVKAEARGEAAEKAVEIATAGAMAVELATGVGAAAAPATFVAGLAARAGIKTWVKNAVKRNKNKPDPKGATKKDKVDADTEDRVRDMAVNRPQEVANAIAGNVDALAKAQLSDGIQKLVTNSVGKKKTNGQTFTVTDSDSFGHTVTGIVNDSYTQTASSGHSKTTNITFNHGSMNKMATSGYGEGADHKTSAQIRQDAATTAAKLKNGERKKPDGTAYTPAEHQYARQEVARAMMGNHTGSEDVDTFKNNFLYEHFLTGQVSSLTAGSGNPIGPSAAATHTNYGLDPGVSDKGVGAELRQGEVRAPYRNTTAQSMRTAKAAFDKQYAATPSSVSGLPPELVDKFDQQRTETGMTIAAAAGVDALAGAASGLFGRGQPAPTTGGSGQTKTTGKTPEPEEPPKKPTPRKLPGAGKPPNQQNKRRSN